MRKILAIAYKDIYGTYTDLNLMVIMLVTPVILATIISIAFSGLSGSSAPINDIPVVIVNQDEGADGLNMGSILTGLLIPAPGDTAQNGNLGTCPAAGETSSQSNHILLDLTEAVQMDDTEAARAAVNSGEYAAAIIIPSGFSKGLSYTQENPKLEPIPIEVYGDSGRAVSAGIIRSIVESFTNQMLTGQIAVAATIDSMIARAQSDLRFGAQFASASALGSFNPDFSCAFTPAFNNISIQQQTETGEAIRFNPLVAIGSAQAVLFSLFTAAGSASTILEERRGGTLQRLIVSPTSRITILLGKLFGVFAVVVLQLFFLFIAFTVVGSLLEGKVTFIWGTNWPAIIILGLATALSASGVGMVAAAISKTVEQANIIGSIVGILMGLLGGALFQVDAVPQLEFFTRLSIVRWGAEGFTKLATGQTDILLNVSFLALIGGVLFMFSLWVFNRRQDV